MGMDVSSGPVFLSKKEEDWQQMLAQDYSSSKKKKKAVQGGIWKHVEVSKQGKKDKKAKIELGAQDYMKLKI